MYKEVLKSNMYPCTNILLNMNTMNSVHVQDRVLSYFVGCGARTVFLNIKVLQVNYAATQFAFGTPILTVIKGAKSANEGAVCRQFIIHYSLQSRLHWRMDLFDLTKTCLCNRLQFFTAVKS